MKCKNLNFSFRIICNRCKIPKSDSEKLYEEHVKNLYNHVKINEMYQNQIFSPQNPLQSNQSPVTFPNQQNYQQSGQSPVTFPNQQNIQNYQQSGQSPVTFPNNVQNYQQFYYANVNYARPQNQAYNINLDMYSNQSLNNGYN